MIKVKHNKTGKIYRLLAHAIDSTNSRDGMAYIVYCPDDDENTIYVRDKREFFDKFTQANEKPE